MAPVPSSPFCSLPNSAAAPTPSSGWGSFLGGLPLAEHLLGAGLSPAWIWGDQVSLWLLGWLWGTQCNTDFVFGGSVGCTVRNQWGLAVSRWRWALKRCNKQSCASCPAAAKATGVLAVLGVPRFRRICTPMSWLKLQSMLSYVGWARTVHVIPFGFVHMGLSYMGLLYIDLSYKALYYEGFSTWVCPTWFCPTWVCPTWFCPTWVCPTWVCPTWVCPTWVCPTWVCPTWFCPTWVCPTYGSVLHGFVLHGFVLHGSVLHGLLSAVSGTFSCPAGGIPTDGNSTTVTGMSPWLRDTQNQWEGCK
uniref:Uncharacterized protein n=1 Tax=Coturnix japonica TaxID=93934 RepID=A0A8C2UBW4_COTJA